MLGAKWPVRANARVDLLMARPAGTRRHRGAEEHRDVGTNGADAACGATHSTAATREDENWYVNSTARQGHAGDRCIVGSGR